jgi:hypothetical protein
MNFFLFSKRENMVSVKGDSALGIVIAIIVLAVLIWNVVYIYGVRKELETTSNLNLSLIAADIIFGIDIVLIVIVGIYLIYNMIVIFTTKEQITAVTQAVTQPLNFPVTKISMPVGTLNTATAIGTQ